MQQTKTSLSALGNYAEHFFSLILKTVNCEHITSVAVEHLSQDDASFTAQTIFCRAETRLQRAKILGSSQVIHRSILN